MNNQKKILVLGLVFLIGFLSFISASDDAPVLVYLQKSQVPGYSNTLSGDFGVSLSTGSGVYSYDIETLPGVNGLAPSVNLFYSSHSYKDSSGVLGSGWRMNENYIQRDVNYSFSDSSDDSFILVLNGQSYDLVYDSSDSKYHTKIESFLDIQKLSGGNNNYNEFWRVRTKDGVSYYFGQNYDSELVSNLHSYVTRWSLDIVNDTHNNSIFYSYLENPFTNDLGAVYLDKIEYNNDKKKVINFTYQSYDKPISWEVYKQGNKIEYSRRLGNIEISYDGSLISKYVFNYERKPQVSLDFLSNITRYGSDGVTSLPAAKFSYNDAGSGWSNGISLPHGMPNYDGGYRFADFNRDGLLDTLQAYCDNDDGNCANSANWDVDSWVNTGSGWNSSVFSDAPIYFTQIHSDTGARLADVNGDGLTDILYSEYGQTRKVWINDGDSWNYDSSWSIPVDFVNSYDVNYEDMKVRLADVNGDGLVDIVYADWSDSAGRTTWINTGSGWSSDSTWELPTYFVWYNDVPSEDFETRFVDLNSDGLIDIINSAYATPKAWINTGNGWTEDGSWYPSGVDFFGGVGDGSSDGDLGWRSADLNSDGLVDFIRYRTGQTEYSRIRFGEKTWVENSSWHSPQNFVKQYAGRDEGARLYDINGDGSLDIVGDGTDVRNSNVGKAYLLSQVVTEQGATIDMDYIASTSLDNTGLDSIGDMGFNLWLISNITKDDGLGNVFVTSYNYSGGLYDYEDEEFRGFSFVEENFGEKIVRHWYHQDDYRKNKEYKTEVLDSSEETYSTTLNDWGYSDEGGYYEVSLDEVSSIVYSPLENKTVNVSYSYDVFGNVVYIRDKGDVLDSSDDTTQYYEYMNNYSLWVVVLKKAQFFDFEDTKLSESFYSYDGLDYDTTPVLGDLTKEEHWNNNGENVILEKGYDSYGNLVNETDAMGNVVRYVYGLRDTSYTFLDRVIDSLGFVSDYEYDWNSSKPLWVRDSNGNYVNYSYDLFGRISSEVMVYDNSSYPTISYEYDFNGTAPEKIKISSREEGLSEGTFDKYQFLDGFGKVVQTKFESADDKQIIQDVVYDRFGRKDTESNFYFDDFFENYTLPDSVSFVNYSYDILDRVILQINPDGTNVSVNYSLWNVSYYDENLNRIDNILDSHGNILKVLEYNSLDIYETSYSYDGLGNLISIVDDSGNFWNFSYDSLGRKLSMFDPDSGFSNYSYDLNGNLISEVVGSGNLVSDGDFYREYNNFGQLIRIRNVSSSGTILEEYTYSPSGDRVKTYNYLTDTTTYTPFKEFTQIRNSSGIFNYTYIYDGSDLVSRINPDGSKYFYHPDHLGSTSLITNESGEVVENVIYYPYGLPMVEINESKLYEGMEFDVDVGQYYYGSRYYDPEKRIFVQPDSLIPNVYDPQKLNIYSFERNNPYSYVDPDGHEEIKSFKGVQGVNGEFEQFPWHKVRVIKHEKHVLSSSELRGELQEKYGTYESVLDFSSDNLYDKSEFYEWQRFELSAEFEVIFDEDKNIEGYTYKGEPTSIDSMYANEGYNTFIVKSERNSQYKQETGKSYPRGFFERLLSSIFKDNSGEESG